MPYHQAVQVDHPVLETVVVEYMEGFLEGVDSILLLTFQYFDDGCEKVVLHNASAAVPQPNITPHQ